MQSAHGSQAGMCLAKKHTVCRPGTNSRELGSVSSGKPNHAKLSACTSFTCVARPLHLTLCLSCKVMMDIDWTAASSGSLGVAGHDVC